jgi:hypothetical protein
MPAGGAVRGAAQPLVFRGSNGSTRDTTGTVVGEEA